MLSSSSSSSICFCCAICDERLVDNLSRSIADVVDGGGTTTKDHDEIQALILLVAQDEMKRRRCRRHHPATRECAISGGVVVSSMEESLSAYNNRNIDLVRIAFQRAGYHHHSSGSIPPTVRTESSSSTNSKNSSSSSHNNSNTQDVTSGGASATGPKSFSLFDSWATSGLLRQQQMIAWDIISEEETSISGKIDRLSSIQYIDDIIPDWDQIQTFFQSTWTTIMSRRRDGSNVGDDDNNRNSNSCCDGELYPDSDNDSVITLAYQLLRLHRKWYHLTRQQSSSNPEEYTLIQIGLVQNLVDFVNDQCCCCMVTSTTSSTTIPIDDTQHINDHNNNDESVDNNIPSSLPSQEVVMQKLIVDVMICILDMFADWMDRSFCSIISNHDRIAVQAIAASFWDWYQNDTSKGSSFLQRTIRGYCMQGNWLKQYIVYHLTVDEVVQWTTTPSSGDGAHNNNMIQFLWTQATHAIQQQQKKAAVVSLATTVSTSTKTDVESNDHNNETYYAQAVFALSILHSILSSTRMAKFPWHHLLTNDALYSTPTTTNNMEPYVAQESLFRLYVQLIDWCSDKLNEAPRETTTTTKTTVPADASIVSICAWCCDAMTILLLGIQMGKNSNKHNNNPEDPEEDTTLLEKRMSLYETWNNEIIALLDRIYIVLPPPPLNMYPVSPTSHGDPTATTSTARMELVCMIQAMQRESKVGWFHAKERAAASPIL